MIWSSPYQQLRFSSRTTHTHVNVCAGARTHTITHETCTKYKMSCFVWSSLPHLVCFRLRARASDWVSEFVCVCGYCAHERVNGMLDGIHIGKMLIHKETGVCSWGYEVPETKTVVKNIELTATHSYKDRIHRKQTGIRHTKSTLLNKFKNTFWTQ